MARTTRQTVLNARELRKTMSKPEIMLWQQLRKKPLGIEVDGMAHDMGSRPERDERRDWALSQEGVETIRISAQEILQDAEDVADRILRYIRSLR